MEQNENSNVERGRIAEDYKHSIIQSVEHDEMKHGDTAVEREQYNERSCQLDENEATAKEQYDNNHCEEVTGLSSDGYRHKVIEDYTHEQMARYEAEANQSSDYWDESAKDCGEGATADNQSSMQNGQSDYWESNDASKSTDNEVENENGKSNEASCVVSKSKRVF